MDLSEQEVMALLHSATRGNDTPLRNALTHFGSISSLLKASDSAWDSCRCLSKEWRSTFSEVLKRARSGFIRPKEHQTLGLLRDLGVSVITPTDVEYPNLLHHIADPPPVLYRRGTWQDLNTPQVAMVGARKASPQASTLAQTYASQLAANGLVITSGMAIGIDAFAHKGALESGHTIAVLGCGIDKIYPQRHRWLANQIIRQGCLLSDHPIGTEPAVYNFPKRNRLVSGLSRLVIVVEAARRSGSLVTAGHALDQNKELLAFPWSALHQQGLGCLDLIADGAGVVRDVQDVWLALAKAGLGAECQGMPQNQTTLPDTLSPDCWRLLRLMGDTPVSSVDLAIRSCKPITWVQERLLELELANCVAVAGIGYIRL